jgi:hypothetical protein
MHDFNEIIFKFYYDEKRTVGDKRVVVEKLMTVKAKVGNYIHDRSTGRNCKILKIIGDRFPEQVLLEGGGLRSILVVGPF